MDQKSVVVCDDNPTFLILMKQIFAKRGFGVWTACDGEQGLSLVRAVRPGFLLLDLEMPGTDGMRVLETLQTLDGKKPYTIVLSAYDGTARRERAKELGAQEVWSKPFNAFELTERIQSLIEPAAAEAASEPRA
jgi:CheY-like chemotaxis protein